MIYKRTHMCGQLRSENIGQHVVLNGWIQKRRNLGGLIFCDVRDKTGISQVVFNDETSDELFALADTLRSEYVVGVKGKVVERESKNPAMETGDIEVIADDLVIYSKSEVFQPLLDKLLAEKQIRRNYLAFVHGIMEAGKTMTIDKPIGNDRHNANKKVIYKNGQNALTKVRSLGCSKSKNYSVLYCSLETGRTHQIRLHLSSVSYPILNDPLYGKSSDLCIRMGLFAGNIEMYHPLKEDTLSIDCELPNDLKKLYMQVLK